MERTAQWEQSQVTSVAFRVDGLPQPKGSVTRMPGGGMVPAGTVASRQRKTEWRTDCRAEATRVMLGQALYVGPLSMVVRFDLPAPQMPKWKQGWWPCMKKPDLDKLLRAALDAFTGIIWLDDNQVVSVTCSKGYAWDGKPGADFFIRQVSSDVLRQVATLRKAFAHVG